RRKPNRRRRRKPNRSPSRKPNRKQRSRSRKPPTSRTVATLPASRRRRRSRDRRRGCRGCGSWSPPLRPSRRTASSRATDGRRSEAKSVASSLHHLVHDLGEGSWRQGISCCRKEVLLFGIEVCAVASDQRIDDAAELFPRARGRATELVRSLEPREDRVEP